MQIPGELPGPVDTFVQFDLANVAIIPSLGSRHVRRDDGAASNLPASNQARVASSMTDSEKSGHFVSPFHAASNGLIVALAETKVGLGIGDSRSTTGLG